MSTLEVQRLGKRFPVRGAGLRREMLDAVADVSFTLRPGRVTALVGESGSGKSTVARLLARLYAPTDGKIVFDGKDVGDQRRRKTLLAYRSHVQMIFQDPFASLNPVKRIDHHIARPLQIHGICSRGAVDGRVRELLARVGLVPPDEIAQKYPHQLSGGQRQRVAIARALAVEPSVILADEPISMLDVSIRIGILNLILQLKRELGIAFLYITHDIASARYVADEVLVMYRGRIVEQGPTDAVLLDPQHAYTKLLLSAVPNPESGLRLEPLVRAELGDESATRSSSRCARATSSGVRHDAASRSCSTPCARPRPTDFEATLREVAALGFEGVELFDLHGHDPEVVAGWLQELGLVAVGRHAPLETIETQLAELAAEARGARLAAPGDQLGRPRRSSTTRRSRASPRRPRRPPRAASSSGTTTTTPRSSRASSNGCPRESSSSSMRAGPGTPGPTRSRSSDAGRCVHIKDFRVRGEHSFCPVGDGAVGFERIVPAAARAGVEWLIVEQDEPVGTELDDARRSLAAVITMLGEVA